MTGSHRDDSEPGCVIDVRGTDLELSLSSLMQLAGDPSTRLSSCGFVRATSTPLGPATVAATWSEKGNASVRAEGDGASYLLGLAPGLLGALDDVSTFTPSDRRVAELRRRYPGDRVPRTGTLWHDLSSYVIQQRVTRRRAAAEWRRLLEAFGSEAPGPWGLIAPPDERTIVRVREERLRALGIDGARAATLRRAARELMRLGDRVDDRALVERRLAAVDGIGPWTRTCLSAQTWGDPDTVIVGDSGIPRLVGVALAGQRFLDDRGMLEMLEPFRPHRLRVIRLAFATKLRPSGSAVRRPPRR